MITLFRITTLSHSNQSTAFSFLFPALRQGLTSEVSKPFSYAGLKWLLSIQKNKNILCPHVILPDLNDGVTVTVDCAFTLMNTESFTRNELFQVSGCEFTAENPSHGSDIFIHIEDIIDRKFLSYESVCVFEVTLKNPKIAFHSVLTLEHKPHNMTTGVRRDKMLDFRCYNTEKFHYGDFDWLCVFCPNMDHNDSNAMRHMLQLNRAGRSDILCKLVYSIRLGRNSKYYQFPVREEVFDFGGNGEGLYFEEDYTKYLVDNCLEITIRLYRFSYVSQLKLSVPKPDKKSTSYCFDSEKQTWSVISELNPKSTGDRLGFTVFYGTSRNIPKNYIRFIAWSLTLVSSWPSGAKKISLSDKPIERYYSSLQPDKGTTFISKLTAKELNLKGNEWIDNTDNRFSVYLEWHCSYAISALSYSVYDDIYRRQYAQMRQEIVALQRENNQLEKELYKYQQCISRKCNQPKTEKTLAAQDNKPSMPRRHSSATSETRSKSYEARRRMTTISVIKEEPPKSSKFAKLPSPSLNDISKSSTLTVPRKPVLSARRHSAADVANSPKRNLNQPPTDYDLTYEKGLRKGTKNNVLEPVIVCPNLTYVQSRYGSALGNDLTCTTTRHSAQHPREYICRYPVIQCSKSAAYRVTNPVRAVRCIPDIAIDCDNSQFDSHSGGMSHHRGGRAYSNPEIFATFESHLVPNKIFSDMTFRSYSDLYLQDHR